MGQNTAAQVALAPTGGATFLKVDAEGALITSTGEQAASSWKGNITAANVVKATAGEIGQVSVLVAATGNATGTINDCATTGAVGVANQIAAIPSAVGTYPINWETSTGIVVVPATGQTIAVTYK